MGFGEIVAATVVGAAVPIFVNRYLDFRLRKREREAQARQTDALAQTGFGRYMVDAFRNADKIAGDLVDKRSERESDS